LSGWFAWLHISAILVLVVIAIVGQWIQLFPGGAAATAVVAAAAVVTMMADHEVPL
jgi:hypothetical protein